MTTATSSVNSFPSSAIDPMEDLDEIGIQQPDQELSERAEELADGIFSQPLPTGPKKRAYFVVTAKEGDLALRTPERDSDREMNMEILRRQGYEVTLFKSNRAFFDHVKQDRSMVDLLVIADHGNPTRVGDLRVEGENIVSHDLNLSEEERVSGFQSLKPILNEDSILLFHACLAGNKTIENNIARVASRILPQTDIYACQYLTLYEPGFEYKLDEEKGVVIDTINYGFAGVEGTGVLGLARPAIYRNGKELTGQPAAPLPPPRSNPRRFSPNWVGAIVVGAIAAIVGIGAWYYTQTTSKL